MEHAALVLEGGGMRGIYTAGLLDYFLEQELFFERVYGVSAGACHACSYLSRQFRRAFNVSVDYLQDKRYCSTSSLLKTGDLFGVKMVYDTIPNQLSPYDYDAYQNSESKLTAVLTNCETGEAEYYPIDDMRKGLIAVRASASLPLLSRMVEIDGKRFLDGGVTDSIPLAKALEDGFDKAVVILTQHNGYRKRRNSLMPLVRVRYRRYPKLVAKMADRHTRYNRSLAYLRKQEALGKAFVIRPKQPLEVDRIEKDAQKLHALYLQGYADAQAHWKDLLDYLKK